VALHNILVTKIDQWVALPTSDNAFFLTEHHPRVWLGLPSRDPVLSFRTAQCNVAIQHELSSRAGG